MQLGEILNENNAEVANHERIDLGVHVCASVMNGVADNPYLRNETNTLLREVCIEYVLTARECNQSKVKIK